MPVTIKDLMDDLDFLSDRISAQVRTIALSVLAFAWLILAGSNESLPIAERCNRQLIGGAAILAFAALVMDYLQYFFGYIGTRAIQTKAEENTLEQIEYDYSDWRYKLRRLIFWLKQIALGASIVVAATAIIKALGK